MSGRSIDAAQDFPKPCNPEPRLRVGWSGDRTYAKWRIEISPLNAAHAAENSKIYRAPPDGHPDMLGSRACNCDSRAPWQCV
jgi:hypothetical protein